MRNCGTRQAFYDVTHYVFLFKFDQTDVWTCFIICRHLMHPVARCWAFSPRSFLLYRVLISEQVDSSIHSLYLLSRLLLGVYLTDGVSWSSLSGAQVHNSFSLYWPPVGQNWCAGGRWFAGDPQNHIHIPLNVLNSSFQRVSRTVPLHCSHCNIYSFSK